MAFQTIVEDSRRMNAKMIAMGQSVDIQKMPRPKVGTQMAQKQAMYTPSGSDVEKMLYPKNFKARTFEPEPIQTQQQKVTQEIVDEIQEQERPVPAKIIGDDAIIEQPRREAQSDANTVVSGPRWARCKHYKAQGDRAFCKEYLGFCAKDKCARPNY